MVREFSLINDENEEFSLMDIENFCLLTNPSGLGYEYNNNYEQVGSKFVNTSQKINQNTFNGEINFINYDNYYKFVDYIEKSKKIRIRYKIPSVESCRTYYRDAEFSQISKTEIKENGILSESISIDFTSLWYVENSTNYTIKSGDDVRWDFKWDSRFLSNTSNSIDFENVGHIPSRVVIELHGYIVNPAFKVVQNGDTIYDLPINTTIQLNEKLVFCTLENNFYIKKINLVTNEETSLFTLDNIVFDKDYILKLPVGKSTLIIESEEPIANAKVDIYSYFKAV